MNTIDCNPAILLAEDEPALRELYVRQLRRSGYEVREAADGAEALRQFDQHRPILLLITDILMPEMDGLELAGKLRRMQPDLPVLFMSGHLNDEKYATGLASFSEPVGTLQKPLYTLRALTGKTEEILGSQGAGNYDPDRKTGNEE